MGGGRDQNVPGPVHDPLSIFPPHRFGEQRRLQSRNCGTAPVRGPAISPARRQCCAGFNRRRA
jgi:hypothetical protein